MRLLIWSLILTLSASVGLAQQAADTVAPESGTLADGAGAGAPASTVVAAEALSAQLGDALRDKDAGRPVQAQDWMVVTAHPLASQAGARVLREGGTAADAMVAVQAVLGLVEPQSSGLGGGAFLVWWDAETRALTTLDGRETAPLGVTPRLFQTDAGEPLEFFDAVIGGRSVGTPGTPALMQEAHKRWGRSNWAGLFTDAISHAEQGFAVSERMAASIKSNAESLSRFEATRNYFIPGGVGLTAGALLRNPDYALTLRDVAGKGAQVFYTGAIAKDIVATVQGAPDVPGVLAEIDLALYRVRERAPVCVPYRGHDVCGMGPPSSGALSVGQILGMLQGYDLAALGAANPESWRLIGDASRLAFADRGRYIADTDFVPVPTKGLIAQEYLEERGALLRGDDALPEVRAGQPEFDHALNLTDGGALDLPSTSHISIVDSYGNALAMTTTIENAFGSRLMVRGFLLNNELTDFSFRTHLDGVPVANRVEPGKRPRSSMAPTIVLKDGAPVLVLGSPGGSRIIPYVAKTIIAMLDWGMDAQRAVALPHLVNRFGIYDLEKGTDAAALAVPLQELGYGVSLVDLNSGLHVIAIGDTLEGGADPRREGVALGQ